jgi:acyl carrier protein
MPDQASEVRQRIRALLLERHGADSFVATLSESGSLREQGLSSAALVSLLVVMEDAFGFEWDDDVQPEVLRSISSLADHVLALGG